MRWHKDLVQNPISIALKIAGCACLDISMTGRGAPDELVILVDRVRLFEYKSGTATTHKKKGQPFTPDQIAWQKRNPRLMIYYRVIETREQAFKEMGLL